MPSVSTLACAFAVVLASSSVRAAPAAQVAQTADASAPVSALAASYPNMPTSWPDPDETKGGINILLDTPLVVEGMKKVKAAVPAAILALPPSTQLVLGSGDVTYPGGAAAQAANCHIPGGCYRSTAAAYYDIDYTSCTAQNAWGLTYDDGPTGPTDTPNTADLQAQLDTMKLKATFFVAGSPCFYYPTVCKTIFDKGNEVAVHTWSHAAMTSLTNEQIVAEILFTEAWIVRTVGVKPIFFRPPFGDVDDRVRGIIGALGYKNIVWAPTKSSEDTGTATTAETVATVKSWFVAQPGFISLEHNITPATTAKSIAVLQAVQALGAAFPLQMQPVGTCLGMSAYAGGAAVPAGNTTTAASSVVSASPAAATSVVVVSGVPVTKTSVVLAPGATATGAKPTGTAASTPGGSAVVAGASGRTGVVGLPAAVVAVGAAAVAACL
ncbi:chitin deacetylase [Thoreauomyces humboldtii]|nr:chitin deacetylase [Thoreauomyces humboldtii]